MSSLSKSDLITACIDRVQQQIDELEAAVLKVKESIVSEDKSSVGDKFETSRAMAQKEMEILIVQLDKSRTDYGVLSQIDPDLSTNHVQLGSLVKTEHKYLFIAVALGKVSVDKADIYVVSPTSPIAQKILGKESGFKYQVGPQADSIVKVY